MGGLRSSIRDRRAERGAAAVEFALVVPLLLVIIFGIIEYGYMLSYRQAVSQSASEGARAAAVTFSPTVSAPITSAVNAVNDSLGNYGISCSATPALPTSTSASGNLRKSTTTVGTCSVTLATCTSAPTYKCATVTLNHKYADHPLIPSFPGIGLVLPKDLAYTAVAEINS